MNRYTLSIAFAGIFIASALLVGTVSTPAPVSAASCTGTWQYQESDISDLACVSSTSCVPNPNNTNVYSAMATCPSANPDATPCTVGSPVLLQGVSGPRVYGNHCKWNSVEGNSNLVQTSVYACVDSGGSPIPTSCGTTPQTVTATLVANPTTVVPPERSMLTWSSTNATSCTGTNFPTGGATSGSVFVAPTATTLYAVDCTNGSSSASGNATVSVPSSQFSVSCSVTPSTIRIGETATWSSTVTGGSGLYYYSWSGTDGLSGSGSVVQKIYNAIGHKSGRLTVTYKPSPDHQVMTEPSDATAATAFAAGEGNWVVSGPTTGYACVEDWATAMYADNSFNGVICPASNTCTAAEIGTTCFSMTNTPPSCAYGGTGDHEIHITPYTCTAVAQPPTTTQCPAGQTAVRSLANMSGAVHCEGGATIARGGDTLDGASYGGNLQDYLISFISDEGENGGVAIPDGACAMLSFRSGNSIGGGYPPNSNYSITVHDGGTIVEGDGGMFTTGRACSGMSPYSYTCGSMAGIVQTQCVSSCPVVAQPPAGFCQSDETLRPTYGTSGCQNGWQCVPSSGVQVITVDCSGIACTSGTCACTGPNCGGVEVTTSQCSDTLDNDGDGRADYPRDPGCLSPQDDDEVDAGGGQCSDGLDNDNDGHIDCADSACHTDGNVSNASSCDPTRLEKYQCSDGVDNDSDAKADTLDPGCHTDANASNASSYDTGDNSELNSQCSDGIDNDGNGTTDYQAGASGDVGCTSLTDNDESSRAELSLALAANATIVQYGSPATLAWSTTNVRSGSCRITGTNGTDYDFDSGPLGGTSGTVTTTNKPLKSQVTFTLSCKNLSGQTVNTTAVVRVTPRSGEF